MSDQGTAEPAGPEGQQARRGWRGWAQIALVLAAIGIAYYFARAPAVDPIEGDGLAGVAAPRPTVQVVRPAVVQASRQVAATGVVSAVGGVALRSQVAGKAVFVSPSLRAGASFAAGQPLVRIERRDYELRLAAAEAQLRYAEAELLKQRLRGEYRSQRFLRANPGATVPSIVARLPQIAREEAEVEWAKVLIEKAKVDLARTTLSLPFDGWVRTSTLLVGEVVRPAKAVARVFPKDAVQVEARLSEADMAALGECAPAAGASEAGAASTTGCRAPPVLGHAAKVRAGGHLFDVVVERVSAVVNLKSRLATVYMGFADTVPLDALPRPGTFVNVTLDGPLLDGVFVLPDTAQREDGSVWIVADGALRSFAPHGLGHSSSGWLVAPFDPHDGVVVGPVAGAREGLPVVTRTADVGS